MGLLIATFVNGLMRYVGDSETYPLTGSWDTYATDPWRSPYEALYNWDSIYEGDFRPIFEAVYGRRIDPEYRIYQPEQLKEGRASFVYTPFVALSIEPWVKLSRERRNGEVTSPEWNKEDEKRLWKAADQISFYNHIFWLISAILLYLMMNYRLPHNPWIIAFYVLAFILYYPFAKALQLTQASIWIYTFLVGSLFAFQRKWYIPAGILLALGVSIKPHLVLLPFLLIFAPGFPRKTLVATFATLMVTGLTSLIYAGWQNSMDYVQHTLPTLSAGYAYYPNQSINGLLLRLFEGYDPADFNLVKPHGYIKTISSIVGLSILGVTFWFSRQITGKENHDGNLLALSCMVIAGTVASPVCWYHHLSALSGPFVIIVYLYRKNLPAVSDKLVLLLLLIYLLIGYYYDTRYLGGIPAALFSAPGFYGGLMLLGVSLYTTKTLRSGKE